MSSLLRLGFLFVLTILGGVVATMLAPVVASAHYTVHAQESQVAAASQGTRVPYARATSAPPVQWTRAVATRALVRGDTLRAEDFVLADTAVHGRLPYGVDTTTPRAGWLVQRAIAPGEWVRMPGVVPVPAISAGGRVTALWSDGSVQLSVSAVALSSAPVGAAVSVRVGRNRRLSAVVIAPDSVRLR